MNFEVCDLWNERIMTEFVNRKSYILYSFPRLLCINLWRKITCLSTLSYFRALRSVPTIITRFLTPLVQQVRTCKLLTVSVNLLWLVPTCKLVIDSVNLLAT